MSTTALTPSVSHAATTPTATPADVTAAVAAARATFESGATKSLASRRRNVSAVRRLLEEHRSEFEAALFTDLHKGRREAGITEIDVTIGEAAHAQKHLRRWIAPKSVSAGPLIWPASARIVPEPLGVILVMSPWNYPVNLTLDPLVGVLAAGNSAVLVPSPDAPHTAETIARLIPQYFPDGAVHVLLGAVDVAQNALKERFDHIVFTGSGRVGRIVMEAAAQNLTPVTLELGGKSPVWVDDDRQLTEVARRLAWAKFTNAGQTCVAPDYVLTTPDHVQPLVAALREAVAHIWGADPAAGREYGRIASERHFDRLAAMLEEGNVEFGGRTDRDDLYIEPTVVTFPNLDETVIGDDAPFQLLREEIFGPILPILTVSSKEEAARVINAWDKPLALYVFGDAATRSYFAQHTSAGAQVNGAAIVHAGIGALPFGGVGASGMGADHGVHSFRRFSHLKPVLTKPLRPDTLRLLNPGTSERLLNLVGSLQRRG